MNGKPGRDGPLGPPGNGYCPTLPNVPNYKSFLNHKPITPPAPTYHDIIKEAKRQFAKNQKDFRIEKHRINEEIKLLRQRQERIDKELDRLQAKATKKPYEAKNDFDKFLLKLRSEARTEREFLVSLSSSTSSTEDYNCEEEECQEKPEMDCI